MVALLKVENPLLNRQVMFQFLGRISVVPNHVEFAQVEEVLLGQEFLLEPWGCLDPALVNSLYVMLEPGMRPWGRFQFYLNFY